MTTLFTKFGQSGTTKTLAGLVVFALIFFPIFTHLDSLPIRVWDEARNALNAYEMSKNGQWFVTYFEGKPDLWNTKPPLLIWMQVFWIKLLGFNELSIRMPSAIAAFVTIFIFFRFLKTTFNSAFLALIPVFVLVTSTGFLGEHAARNGDYDALLTLFTTTSALCFYRLLQIQKAKYFYFFFLSLTLGVLTKGIAGLLFLPAYFLLALVFKELLNILKTKHFYFGALFFVVVVLSYYFIRESQNPGYLKAVYNNELGGRFLEVTENHKASFLFYYSNFFTRFQLWIYLVPCGFLVGLYAKNEVIKNITIFSSIMALSFFLVLSSAQTKLTWYDVPIYPLLSLISGVFVIVIHDFFKNNNFLDKQLNWNVLPTIFLFLIFVKPYERIIENNHTSQDVDYNFYEFSHFLQNTATQHYESGVNVIYFPDYYAHILFYIEKHRFLGYKVELKSLEELNVGDLVFTSAGFWSTSEIESLFQYETLFEKGSTVKIRLIDDVKSKQ